MWPSNETKISIMLNLKTGLVGVLAFGIGYGAASLYLMPQLLQKTRTLSEQQHRYDQAEIARNKEASQQLAAAIETQTLYRKEADALQAALHTKKQQLAKALKENQQRIRDATTHDGVAYTGIGPSGVCLYRSALGYAYCDQRVQNTAGRAAGDPRDAAVSGGGLPPDKLLSHATEYGAYCQALREQLIGLKQFYQTQEQQ